jgi:aromatic-L-amino-acid decarboxylase
LENSMDIEEFRHRGHELIDWMVDYFRNMESYPVRSKARPGEIIEQIPDNPPQQGELFESLFEDFKNIILPGITHWQHPSFFAYFSANNSYPSILAEMLTATIGAQCMIWQTSPAAAELEERVMQWVAQLIGLPRYFSGVIQDTASTATLCSLLTAREKLSEYEINRDGLYGKKPLIVYCSKEAHSSIEKAVKIAGIGKINLRKIDVDENYALLPHALETSVARDLQDGYRPLAVVAATGTTGSTAIDPLEDIGKICKKYDLWLHVDAAYAGTALVLPEFRWMIEGIDSVDSFVFNPHKWMFTNFDCSAYFVKDPGALIRTFEILPEYLKTTERERVNNYRDWGIQLGRRFRALKLWWVIRSFGVQGIQERVRNHISWAGELATLIEATEDFELLAPVPLATLCFRYKPPNLNDQAKLNDINALLLEKLNDTGKVYLTHTKLDGKFTIRVVIGQTNVERRHVTQAWKLIQKTARSL